MKAVAGTMLYLCAVVPLGSPQNAVAQGVRAMNQPMMSSCPSTNSVSTATIHVPGSGIPFLSLCDGHALGGNSAQNGEVRPLALAAGDFDQDGVPDLVSGFTAGKGGSITVHRGNIAALWPYGSAAGQEPPAFFPDARTFSLPEAPDFLMTGDFDADGHLDVVTAQRGSNALYFLRGDGHGGFAAPRRIPVGGSITAMISGEIGHADGLADLIVGVTTSTGARALVYKSPRGALSDSPQIFALPQPVTAMALGRFDGSARNDLAIATGSLISVIHARDPKPSLGGAQSATIAGAKVTVQRLPFAILAMAAGDFTGAGPGIAALDENGVIHILEHAISPVNVLAKAIADPNYRPAVQQAEPHAKGKPVLLSGTLTPSMLGRIEALRGDLAGNGADSPEWTERSTVTMPMGFAQTVPRLVSARVTGSLQDDILALDSGNSKIHVISTAGAAGGVSTPESVRNRTAPVRQPMRLAASLDAASAPEAVLPMRLNKVGLNGLVVLQDGQTAPITMQQSVPAANIFTVTNTQDTGTIGGSAPAGSLRAALNAVTAAWTANNDTGTYEIDFNIPTTDPGYNAATGTFLIQPLSLNAPNGIDDWALPPINATVTIDGYTQPGASPNTLASGGNAKILIQIDGSLATTPGGSGLVPFDDVGSTYRGMDLTGWTTPDTSGAGNAGAEGIEAYGVGDYIEGNFFGTDAAGTVANANYVGVSSNNGPLTNVDAGNIIGGTTPEARNLISGNQDEGVVIFPDAFETAVQGNFIGTDITGQIALPNVNSGVLAGQPTMTIGGTLANDGNVISSNGTDIELNNLLDNSESASGSLVQGNFIGTDSTGTFSVSAEYGTGVLILARLRDEQIGGTTPAAANIISGNEYGVLIADNVYDTNVQGNYIGTDVTGTKAIGNGNMSLYIGTITNLGASAADLIPAGDISVTGNLISGNLTDGIDIQGTSTGYGGEGETYQGNTIQGNLIGTDITGTLPLANQGNGLTLNESATNNLIGGTQPGAGNLIAYNTGNGVLVDPGTANPGEGFGNNTVGNTILSNGGAGVRINSGTQNLISRNSIFGNGDLGIAVGTGGPNINTPCQSSVTGPNDLQNAPVLTAGSGTSFITATATDPNNNTSEFSNAVQATATGNVLSLLGNFNSLPNTTYTIEFFSSTAADPSGYGQGQTYLGSTSVTTDASCGVAISNPVNTADADMSITLSNNGNDVTVGADWGNDVYVAAVANLGPATATNVVVTDTLPASLTVSSAFCDLGACQSPVTTSLGACTVSGQTITCDLGTMAAGATATIDVPVQILSAGSITDTANVTATQTDPNLANNTSSATLNATYPQPSISSLSPASAIAGGADLPMTVYGTGFVPSTAIAFNGTPLSTVGYLDNQQCGSIYSGTYYCSGVQVVVPASLLAAAGTVSVTATNPNPGPYNGSNTPSTSTFTIASACTYSVSGSLDNIENDGTTLIPEAVEVTPNAPTCSWTATSSVPWAVILDTNGGENAEDEEIDVADTGTATGSGGVDIAIAPNTGSASRSGSITVAGQVISFTQGGGSACSYTLGASSANFSAAGGAGTVNVTINGSDCSPSVLSYAPWITSSPNTLLASGPVSFTVAPNTGPPQTGTIMIGGDVFTVSQAAPSCYFTLSSTSASVGAAGGTGSISVTASSPSCAWTAAPSNASQISITSGASGTGNGTVNYAVAANTEGPQTPTITIGNATNSPVPSITSLSPSSATAGSAGFTLTVTGANFVTGAVVNFSGAAEATTYGSATQVAAAIPASAIASAGTAPVTVTNGNGTGNAVFTVNLASAFGCTFTLSSSSVEVPASGISNFFTVLPSYSNCQWIATSSDPSALSITTISSGTGQSNVYYTVAQNTGVPRTLTITAGCQTFTVYQDGTTTSNPMPAITALQPSSATAGSGALTLTVNGSGFIDSSVVNFNGNALTTTFVNPTQLTAILPASYLASATTGSITVTNPTPGGGTSNALTFTVSTPGGGTSNALAFTINPAAANNPVPSITLLSPSSATAGSAGFTLTVTGANFVSGAVVNFSGNPTTTTYVSATQLTAAIPATDLASAGTPAVTVTNPSPGGGTSNALTFDVTSTTLTAQTITFNNPGTQTVGTPLTLVATASSGLAVTFTSATTGVCTISGTTATFITSGTCTIDANQAGNSTYAAAPQVAQSFAVNVPAPAPDFAISATPLSQSVAAGQAGSLTVTVADVGSAFTSAVTLSVTGLPTGVTGTFNPTTITPGSSSGTSILTVQVPASFVMIRRNESPAGLRLASIPAFASLLPILFLLPLRRTRKRWRNLLLAVVALTTLGATAFLFGCGGGFGFPQQSQTYSLTITGASGSDTHSTTVQLTVQ